MSVAVKFENVSKKYRLGGIGGGTLRADMQSFAAKLLKKQDPNEKIGQPKHGKNEVFYALSDVSFSVDEGEVLGLIGGNGAGKSTLLKLLSGITVPTSGRITYAGRVAGMLEIGTGFHPEMTGRENVYLNGAILGMSSAEITDKFDEIVEFSEVGKFIDTPVKRYSSGMFVKLAFSVAAHLNSDIMLMDEVLAVGDVRFREKCMKKMLASAKSDGKTVIYVSHNMDTVRKLCKRCVVLESGSVIYDGETEGAIEAYTKHVCNICPKVTFENREAKTGFKSVAFSDGDGEYFSTHMQMRFEYVTDRTYSLRLEIKTPSDAPVGAYIAENVLLKGTDSVELRFDIGQLPDGVYKTSAYIYNGENGEDEDCVSALCFKVNRGIELPWDRRWGRVKLPTPVKI